jgi:thiosulfate dehydrogenase [quinone] large subunit
MLQSYFESLKYVGHLLPVSFLRIFLGYFYIEQALHDWKLHILGSSAMSDLLVEALTKSNMPYWYRFFLSEHLIPHWNIYAFILVGVQLAIGLSYVIGYVVRPISILALLFCLNYLAVATTGQEFFFKLMIACHLFMAWVGAGRCLGLDYYFYKRYRGVWW